MAGAPRREAVDMALDWCRMAGHEDAKRFVNKCEKWFAFGLVVK
jgi:hypothetical protein